MDSCSPLDCGLPHREPFVFIDTVVEVEAGRSAVCSKRFGPEEAFFRGHFPGNPLVPGVILTEAAAQTAGIAAGRPGVVYHLSAIRGMKFLRAVLPGSLVEFSAVKTAEAGGLAQFQVTARVDGEVVAEGVIVLNEARGNPGE
jgi:3-hydroxyacyl-[acyl-carrier-protein] dehydratase